MTAATHDTDDTDDTTAEPSGHGRIARILLVLAASATAVVLVRILFGDAYAAKAATGVFAGFLLTATTRDPRIGGIGVAVLTASVFVALAAAGSPAAGAAWTALMAVGVGIAARAGIAGTWFIVTVPTAFMLISPLGADTAAKITAQQVASVAPGTAAGFAAVTALCGLWAVAVCTLVPPLPAASERTPLPLRASVALTVIVAVATVPTMWFVLADDRIPNAGWWLLTVYVVTMPQPGDLHTGGRRRTAHRVAGTVAGVIVAAALSSVLRSTTVLHVVGAAFFVAAFTQAGDPARYWRFVALLTPGVVLLGSTAATARATAELRLEFTVLGALVVVIAIGAVALLAEGTRLALRNLTPSSRST